MYNNSNYAILENKTDHWRFPQVLCLNEPFLVGNPFCIWTRQEEKVQEMMDDLAHGRKTAAKVPGYNIFIFPSGTLTHDRLEEPELSKILREMADFFLNEKATRYPDVYDRFKEL